MNPALTITLTVQQNAYSKAITETEAARNLQQRNHGFNVTLHLTRERKTDERQHNETMPEVLKLGIPSLIKQP